MKKLYTFTVALIVLLSMSTSAQALEDNVIIKYQSEFALTYWTNTNGDTTDYNTLFITQEKGVTEVLLYIETYGADNSLLSTKWGQIHTEKEASINGFNSASISKLEIDMYDYYTGEFIETVILDAAWTPQGEILKYKYRDLSKSKNFIDLVIVGSMWREASVTKSINNVNLGTSYGELGTAQLIKVIISK